ncbi:alpha/beta fold hydrolase [Candidatus Bipolaricaulota bacterium]|nr:alpha/beta fold hydrolase [Candidatus Bipolaricaulota bacterium]
MSKARINGIDINYEVHGEGEPLLLIQGLGHSSEFWFLQVPEFSKHFQTIIYNNRGIGKSDKPNETYSIAGDALDAVALLDHLRIERSHVLGVSRGGYIAQELAISHPERVRRLILMSTHYGGPEYLEATRDLWAELFDVTGLSLEEIYRKAAKYLTSEAFYTSNPDMIDRMVAIRMANPQPAYAFQHQFQGAAAFDASRRVSQIDAPTLVIAGTEDRVVPMWLSEKLASAIPEAGFVPIDGAGHLSFIEQPELINKLVTDFLED